MPLKMSLGLLMPLLIYFDTLRETQSVYPYSNIEGNCDDGQDHGVYCRKIKNKHGLITAIRYEPRLKRDGQSIWLGQFDDKSEAKLVRDIAAFFYRDDEFGWLDFEGSCYCFVQSDPDPDGGRYFKISKLTEEKEGKEKAELVKGKVKEVHNEFKKKQAEYRDLWMAAISIIGRVEGEGLSGDGVVNVEGLANGHWDTRRLDLMNTPGNTQLQQPPHNDRVGNSALDGINMLGNHGLASNISSALGDASEPTLFNVTNPVLLSDHRELLDRSNGSVPALPGDNSLGIELAGSHTVSYEAGQAVAHVPFPDSTPKSGSNFNSGNQVETLLQQLVNSLQQDKQDLKQEKQELKQEKQELKQENQELKQENQELKQENQELKQENQKIQELEAQLLELQHVKDHVLRCTGANRPSKKRQHV